jgi:hypothetical protein
LNGAEQRLNRGWPAGAGLRTEGNLAKASLVS